MSGRSTRRALGTALAALVLSVSACGGEEGATVQGVKLIEKGVLTSCTHLPYPPFESPGESGEVVGFDVDLVDLVATRLGLTQKIVDTPFETMKTGSALNAGKCDIQMGGMTITDERKEFMTVSAPYFDVTQSLMAKKGSGVTSLDDVKAKDLKIGSQAGTTGEDYLTDRGFDPVSFDNANAELNGLRTGQVDVVVVDSPVAGHWRKSPSNSDLEVVADLETGEQLGLWFRKNHNPELVKLTNDVIAQARADGTYKKIHEKWIGPMPDNDTAGGS